MAEKIVFGADIDNVTIKNIDGKLTAVVNVEDVEDEFEVVNDYVEPREDDDYYVEPVFAKFRHKATQLLTDAYKKEKKPRSAPVNESLDRQLTAGVQADKSYFTIYIETAGATSLVDGADFTATNTEAYNHQIHVQISDSDYANAKAFNEAHAGKTFTVTTQKRYAKSEGHPIVKPTEIQVPYPTLPYAEKSLNLGTVRDKHLIYVVFQAFDPTEPEILRENLNRIGRELTPTTFTVHYTFQKSYGHVLTGTQTFTDRYTFDRREVADYRDNNNDINYQKWEFEPFVVENFYGKYIINPKPYEAGFLVTGDL